MQASRRPHTIPGAFRVRRRVEMCGHAMLSAMVGWALLGIGSTGLARWTAHLLAAERHHTQESLSLELMHDLLETGCQPELGTMHETVELGGTRFQVTTERHHAPADGDPAAGHHLALTLAWTTQAGQARERRLLTYCTYGPRAY